MSNLIRTHPSACRRSFTLNTQNPPSKSFHKTILAATPTESRPCSNRRPVNQTKISRLSPTSYREGVGGYPQFAAPTNSLNPARSVVNRSHPAINPLESVGKRDKSCTLQHKSFHISTLDSDPRSVYRPLAVLNTCLDIRVRGLDELPERCGVGGRSRSQLHMAHELAGALQQAARIGQRCAVKEAHINM